MIHAVYLVFSEPKWRGYREINHSNEKNDWQYTSFCQRSDEQAGGFASCWETEPMALEDVHGKVFPIPLELVMSWELRPSVNVLSYCCKSLGRHSTISSLATSVHLPAEWKFKGVNFRRVFVRSSRVFRLEIKGSSKRSFAKVNKLLKE